MRAPLRTAALGAAAAIVLSGCSTYDDHGYGYGGVSAGYGSGYYDPRHDDYWNYYGHRPYWGWHDGYYYPGTGIYIYDRRGRGSRWSDRHRRYWIERRDYWDRRGHWEQRRGWRDNWRDFRRDRRDCDRRRRRC